MRHAILSRWLPFFRPVLCLAVAGLLGSALPYQGVVVQSESAFEQSAYQFVSSVVSEGAHSQLRADVAVVKKNGKLDGDSFVASGEDPRSGFYGEFRVDKRVTARLQVLRGQIWRNVSRVQKMRGPDRYGMATTRFAMPTMQDAGTQTFRMLSEQFRSKPRGRLHRLATPSVRVTYVPSPEMRPLERSCGSGNWSVEPQISGDGNWWLESCGASRDGRGPTTLKLRNLLTDSVQVVAENIKTWSTPSISDDGSIVAFSTLTRLSSDDFDGNEADVYRWARDEGAVEYVSAGAKGISLQGESGFSDPKVSGDGQFIAFTSGSGNFPSAASRVFLWTAERNSTQVISPAGTTFSESLTLSSISDSGHVVAWTAFKSGDRFEYLHRWTSETGESENLAIIAADGASDDFVPPDMSDDGDVIVYRSRRDPDDRGQYSTHKKMVSFHCHLVDDLCRRSPEDWRRGVVDLSGDGRRVVSEVNASKVLISVIDGLFPIALTASGQEMSISDSGREAIVYHKYVNGFPRREFGFAQFP